MKSSTRIASQLPKVLLLALFLTLAPAALASTTWYVDGVNGNDSNDCLSSQTACKTIGHAISLCASGDTIKVAPAIYMANLTIGISLKILGSDAKTTIVDGNQAGTVFTIPNVDTEVRLSKLTIRNGYANGYGGGIANKATLILNNSTISGNVALTGGGGISNVYGTLIINKSTIRENSASDGGGIHNMVGTVTINNSTIAGNSAVGGSGGGIDNIYKAALTINNSTFTKNSSSYWGGGIDSYNNGSGDGTLTINNSTFNGNAAGGGGAITNWGDLLTISNSTISGNGANQGGGVQTIDSNATTLQNTVVANSPSGGNCSTTRATITSNGYNLSSDDTCNFNGSGDMNNTEPKLGELRNNGGPTQTIRLLPGSPAIDAGNPNGCTDDKGNLLTTDQRGWARPGKKDTGGCDMGAFERQKD